MSGYFSFRNLITPRFVKFIYVLGLIVITASGIAMAFLGGRGLRSATLPTRIGLYYIAIGVGLVIVVNLVWRVLCEIIIIPFNLHNLLASSGRETVQDAVAELPNQKGLVEFRQEVSRPEPEAHVTGRPTSVLGLS